MQVKFVHFGGIDVSKEKIDVCVLFNGDRSEVFAESFAQSRKGFACLKKWLQLVTQNQTRELLLCVENTGLYDDALLYYLTDQGFSASVENAACIKRSIRDIRSKNDQLDARNIAIYALQHAGELRIWEKPRAEIVLLQQKLTERNRLIKALKMLRQHPKESSFFSWSNQPRIKPCQAGIKGLVKDIAQIEKDIAELIHRDEGLRRIFRLILSIPAVGKVTAWSFIVYTNEFKTVRSGKQLASYCGVVPFEQTSGKSIRKKPRLSQQANKSLKTLLHLCAESSTRMKNQFGDYYKRKVALGKNGLIAINGIRNKLVLTIAAVVRNNQPYNPNYIYQH